MKLSSQKHLFDLDPSVHYLNCGYMSPLLKSVADAGMKGIQGKVNPFTITPTDFFKDSDLLRGEFSKLIRNDDPNRIAIIPSASYGLSVVAMNIDFRPGDEIILLEEQFPSNYYTWQRIAREKDVKLVTIKTPGGESRGKNWNEDVLTAINSNTRLIAMGHVHWSDGTLFDLVAIRKRANEVGALLVIDGTQSVGALPFYIDEIKPDALICGGYKWLLGPYSLGLAYFGEAFENGVPLEENWINRLESENFSGLVNYQERYQPGALRYEVGEHSNFILVPMLLESIRQLNEWGVENIQEYADGLSRPALIELQEAGYQIEHPDFRSKHLFGIRKEGFDPEQFREKLAENKIYVSVRGTSIRVSVNVFNTIEDIQALKRVCLQLLG